MCNSKQQITDITTVNPGNFTKLCKDNIDIKVNHTIKFYCSGGDHLILDERNNTIYEVQFMVQRTTGNKIHTLVNELGENKGMLTTTRSSVFSLEILTENRTQNGHFNLHFFTHSKDTIKIEGITYMKKQYLTGNEKFYYWVEKGSNVPLIAMKKSTKSHEFIIYANCPEALEKSVMLARSYACYMENFYK